MIIKKDYILNGFNKNQIKKFNKNKQSAKYGLLLMTCKIVRSIKNYISILEISNNVKM